jgi:hypothetical protein
VQIPSARSRTQDRIDAIASAAHTPEASIQPCLPVRRD